MSGLSGLSALICLFGKKARDFMTAKSSKSFGQFFIVHGSAEMSDSNHTGDFKPSANKPEGSSLPMSS